MPDRRTSILLSALLCLSSLVYSQQLTKEQWAEDLQYLQKKINKQFKSFNPSVKDSFNVGMQLLTTQLPTLKDHEIKIGIMKLMAKLRDGHTELNVAQSNAGFHRLPFTFYFFEDQLHIISAHEQHKDLLGARVLTFGQLTVSEVFQKMTPMLSNDNHMEFVHSVPTYMTLTELLAYLGCSDDITRCQLTLELMDGSKREVPINGMSIAEYSKGPWIGLLKSLNVETPLYSKDPQKWYWYKYIPENKLMYFQFRRTNNQDGQPSISKFRKEFFDVIDRERPELLVVDVRNNNGGNYHLGEPFADEVSKRAWLNQPGKVWIVNGRSTFSAAMVTTIFFKKKTKATLIGETGRANPNGTDNNEYMNLPNSKLEIEYTTRIAKHWPEITLDHIPVDVVVPPTFEKHKAGVDPVLEYILLRP